MAGRPALTETAALESYAAAGAQAHAASGVPHSHFQNTQGEGVALACRGLPGHPFLDETLTDVAAHDADVAFVDVAEGARLHD